MSQYYDKKPSILAHGTGASFLSDISIQGLKESGKGNLGAGVYFTTPEYARKIAINSRGKHSGSCVIHCKVDLGRMKEMNGQNKDFSGKWRSNYDSAYRIHGPWINASINTNFPEWCLKRNRIIKIVKVEIIGGTVIGDIQLPGVEITTNGNCRLKGNITADTIFVSGHLTIG